MAMDTTSQEILMTKLGLTGAHILLISSVKIWKATNKKELMKRPGLRNVAENRFREKGGEGRCRERFLTEHAE